MFFNSGLRGARAKDGQGSVANRELFVQKKSPFPSISSWSISGSDDTALNPAGGQTVIVNGTGFATGMTGIVGSSSLASVTVVSSIQVTFTAPANSAGSYTLTLANPDGSAAIYVPGLTYSSVPTYTTAAGSIGSYYETTAISTQVVATSDSALTYSLASGSLPSGATLYANGVITGTSPVDSSSTTYSFAITATDAELQDVTRSFTLTINTDVVTWSTPASGASYVVVGNTPISNVDLSATSAAGYGVTYAANALPTGVSLSGSTISGTPTVEQTVSTLLTATANTTSRTSTRTISWTVTLSDVYFKYVPLLLDGAPAVTSFTNDASITNAQLSITGAAKPSLFNPYTPGYYSNYFDGTGDYLTLASNTAFNIGTTNFTVEGWYYFTALPGSGTNDNLYTFGTYNPYLYLWGDGTIVLRSSQVSGDIINVSHGFSVGQWYHLALVKTNTSFVLYKNGVVLGSGTSSAIVSENKALEIGGQSTFGFNGYMSNFRIVKDTSVYTGAFTPPTSPLTAIANTSLLTCQSNRLIDNSSNAFTITKNGDTSVSPVNPFAPNSSYSTYGSAYFPATSDYTTYVPAGTDIFGTGDFTVECWLNPLAVTGVNIIMASTTTSTWEVLTYANQLYWHENGGNLGGTGYGSIPLNAWSHLAICRSSSVLKMFINGVQVYSAANTYNYSASPATRRLGPSDGGGAPFYISDVRIIKGTGVYTAAFTPPTSPTTAVTNTQLLTYQYGGSATNSTIVDNGSFRNVIVRNGNTSQGTFSPYSQGGWSNYFDGTGDYLTTPTTSLLGTTFTIEFWVYFNTFTSSDTNYQNLLGVNNTISTTGNFILLANYNGSSYTAGALTFFHQNSNKFVVAGGTFTLGKWFHVAVVRNSGTSLIMYVNGVSVGSATISSGDQYGASGVGYIIGTQNDAISRNLNGYISNLRIVNGTALYTATFTPPTSPLTAISGTSLLTCQSNRLIDNSPNNFTITKNGDTSVQAYSPFGSVREATPLSYSMYFDGSDYLTVASNAAFQLGTGSYTFESWIYPTALGSNNSNSIFNIGTYATGLFIRGAATTGIEVYTNNTQRLLTATGLTQNAWQHIALVRNGSACTFYVNGTSIGTFTDSSSISPATATITVGMAAHNSGEFFTGYMSNYRLVKGTAVYTSTFTPSTTPLTAISGTSLLIGQSTTLIDNSSNSFAITVGNDVAPRTVNPFGYTAQTGTAYSPSVNGGSIYLDGSDYLNIATSTNFGFTNGDFTIEFWAYPTVNARQDWVDITDGTNRVLVYYSGSAITFYSVPTNAAVISGPAMVLNSWQHIALSKSSGSSRLFVNGVQVGTTYASNQNYFTTAPVTIGKDSAGSTYVTGYMSDIRIIKGVGIYTSNFVAPTNTSSSYYTNYPSSLLLSFNTGGVVDYHGTNVLETTGTSLVTNSQSPYYTSWSNYFDGSTSYLSLPASSAFSIATTTTPFTIEAWVFRTASGGCVFSESYTGSGSIAMVVLFDNGTINTPSGDLLTLSYYTGSTWVKQAASSSSVVLNTWVHIACVFTGSATKIFVNGSDVTAAGALTTWANTGISGDAWYIGRRWDTSAPGVYFPGYISNFRFVNGTAVYTSAFTPSTTPLTAISGTSLLTCQSNKFIDNSTNNFTITRNGNVKVTPFQPFSSSNTTKYYSMYFGTKTDYFGIRPQPSLVTFAGDFTFECWVYPTDATVTYWGIWDSRQSGATANAIVIMIEPLASPVSGSYRMKYYNGTSYYGTTTILSGQWTYLAWVRSGSTMTFYVNGVAGGTATVSGTQAGNITSTLIYVGSKDNGSAGYGTVGYIADLRITNGYARYSATFTPPTTPLLTF